MSSRHVPFRAEVESSYAENDTENVGMMAADESMACWRVVLPALLPNMLGIRAEEVDSFLDPFHCESLIQHGGIQDPILLDLWAER
ncbi:hypothetical protein TRIATDRAFT_305328 [Trichoderma atroviride IMI 206040]|uniref:Uncharacterized protein n=1 Tax=Hypocrea atroviridis (strain ATCC 20476 / IMI 206040) TaxID=452589 RepID=G9NKU1_HYPAI|nr:uncharacterized protein TRIATDRAFT_305328 [Trichoderma atroviride IMI 206040]EHK48513.1 hypothetical protein TRIATDRAFT_305328 [Trichoderma atroviride IMI 206040]